MNSILLAESGSTKTDWCILKEDAPAICMQTSGINPHLQTRHEIISVLENELATGEKLAVNRLYFYGAGASGADKQNELKEILKDFFGIQEAEVQCDMMGAARALCGNRAGIVSILGTGSNSCFYDGETIKERQISLGYIAGDEGSGNHMGKRVLQYYAYRTFDEELRLAFEQKFGSDTRAIVNRLYKEPFPNRYLASFVQLLKENRGHFMVENIIEDCLNDFFHSHLLKYRQSWNMPLHFAGSVAFEFADVIQTLCLQYEMEFGTVVKSPLNGLIQFHQRLIEAK